MFDFRSLPFIAWCAAGVLIATASLRSAEPLASATVTRVENKVSYGKVISEKSELRAAAANDVVKASDFLLSESESRAELKYDDGTIVRIGQNTIFSFEANTRTMNLKKGTFVFYMPHGKGGGTIKTPSFTAAITGTVAKVSTNIIAVIVGEITLLPSGKKVSEGFFARVNPDGTISIHPFDLAKEYDGRLMTFNGLLPGLAPTTSELDAMLADFQRLGVQGTFDQVNNLPSSVLHFFGTQQQAPTPRSSRRGTPVFVSPPPKTPTPQPSPSEKPPPCSCKGTGQNILPRLFGTAGRYVS
ncbi:MAG TPA: FecR domain-containing protein [Chthoniobacter sp.]